MFDLLENFELTHSNTFGVSAQAKFYVKLHNMESVSKFLTSGLARKHDLFVLGGGSNVLFTRNFDGLIIHPAIRGVNLVQEDDDYVVLQAGAGEVWDDLVKYSVNKGWGGIENLSLIPGMVGACPVQNIGAYGTEVMDYIDLVEGYWLDTGKILRLKAKECRFSYRDSIFKNELKGKILITQVNFRLFKHPVFHTQYPDLMKELDNYPETTISSIREAIIKIRSEKLPDPLVTGNAGSFFKNPIVPKKIADALLKFYPSMPVYCLAADSVKLSAAWLIEQSGWKGKRYRKAGTHKKQPLIIINRGGATGQEILECALKIQKAVMNHFAIKLDMEVNVL